MSTRRRRSRGGAVGGLLGGAGAGGVEDLVEAVEEFGGFFRVLLGEVCSFRRVFREVVEGVEGF